MTAWLKMFLNLFEIHMMIASTCSHCHRSFANMRVLKEHINKHFCATKGAVNPIAARPELRMHLRRQSYQGLLLGKALWAELASRCAYCNSQLGARTIARHYTEQHPELQLFPTRAEIEFVGQPTLGSGAGVCPLCQQRSQKIESHRCALLHQLSILAGQTIAMHPDHFPVTPVNTHPWTTASADQGQCAGCLDSGPSTPRHWSDDNLHLSALLKNQWEEKL